MHPLHLHFKHPHALLRPTLTRCWRASGASSVRLGRLPPARLLTMVALPLPSLPSSAVAVAPPPVALLLVDTACCAPGSVAAPTAPAGPGPPLLDFAVACSISVVPDCWMRRLALQEPQARPPPLLVLLLPLLLVLVLPGPSPVAAARMAEGGAGAGGAAAAAGPRGNPGGRAAAPDTDGTGVLPAARGCRPTGAAAPCTCNCCRRAVSSCCSCCMPCTAPAGGGLPLACAAATSVRARASCPCTAASRACRSGSAAAGPLGARPKVRLLGLLLPPALGPCSGPSSSRCCGCCCCFSRE